VARPGPPPLRPFGLVLHHDGRWSHEGQPILHRRLREHFDRHVVYLPDEQKFVVTLRHFRGEIEIEEAGFFVRELDLERGRLRLSDGREEVLRPGSLTLSPIDGALLCRIRPEARPPEGLLARFSHATHAELLQAVEALPDGSLVLRIGSEAAPIPALD
jgi:hypothetical protein